MSSSVYESENQGIMPSLSLIGGGQLAQMLIHAAQPFGIHVTTLEKTENCPAQSAAHQHLVGDWQNFEDLLKLAKNSEIIGLENEFVPADLLAKLENLGKTVLPSAACMATVQDKFLQKSALNAAGIPIAPMRALANFAELEATVAEWGLPLVLKKRCQGYDGKGNATLKTPEDLRDAWAQLGGSFEDINTLNNLNLLENKNKNLLYVEQFCPYIQELATIITIARDAKTVAQYPIVETIQENHICRVVRAPAHIADEIAQRAQALAMRAVQAVGGVGSFGVELFLLANGDIWLNELAPRVHNSGHYTIEACETSQFENHIRAVMGWPLGSAKMRTPCAVMVNILGENNGSGVPNGMNECLSVADTHVHLYGKARSGTGRKMAHVTALGSDMAETEARAWQAANAISFG